MATTQESRLITSHDYLVENNKKPAPRYAEPITDERRQARVNLQWRAEGKEAPFPSAWDGGPLENPDKDLSEPLTAGWELQPRKLPGTALFMVVETNDQDKYRGYADIPKDKLQIHVYPGDLVVRKTQPITVWGIGASSHERDDYFLESKLPFLSEATIDKYKHMDMMWVQKMGAGKPNNCTKLTREQLNWHDPEPGFKHDEGYVPRQCLEPLESDLPGSQFRSEKVETTSRLHGIPRTLLY